MQFPQQVVQQLIIYDDNGNEVVIIGPGAYLKLQKPGDPDTYWEVALDTLLDIPEMATVFGGEDRWRFDMGSDGNPTFTLKTGSGAEDIRHSWTVSGGVANYDLGDLTDFLRIRATPPAGFSISTNGSGDTLDLQSDGGVLHYDGIPVTREVARTVNLTNTSTFTTTETVTDSVTAPLVNGRVYEIEWSARYTNSTASINTAWRLREDNVSGTNIDIDNHFNPNTVGQKASCRSRYTATSTGNKTFVITGQGGGGTGNVTRLGATGNPSILTVTEVA